MRLKIGMEQLPDSFVPRLFLLIQLPVASFHAALMRGVWPVIQQENENKDNEN